jgi:hypothetical protein
MKKKEAEFRKAEFDSRGSLRYFKFRISCVNFHLNSQEAFIDQPIRHRDHQK